MKKSFIILKIMLLGVVAGVNGMSPWLDDAFKYFPEGPFYEDPNEPLKKAIQDGCWHVVEQILSNSSEQKTQITLAMHYAAEYNQLQVAQKLIARYPHASTQDCLDGLLLEACGNWTIKIERPWEEQHQYNIQQLELVKFALKKGAHLECEPVNPLDKAATFGCHLIIQHLIHKGARVKASSIIAALSQNQSTAVEILLETITSIEKKRILTAICSIKKGHLDECPLFPKDIYQYLTLVLIDQFTQEHMAQGKALLNSILLEKQYLPLGKEHLKSKLEVMQEPAWWFLPSMVINYLFRSMIRPPKKFITAKPIDTVSKV